MLRVREIYHSYGDVEVLRGVSLDIAQGEIVCLLGASGSGKTTLLRLLAGLDFPTRGDILLNGASVLRIPAHARDFGYMFQDYALFPHLDVAQNIAFGLRMRNHPEQMRRVEEMLALVGLAGFENRDVAQLSGGERQRVALARSLAPSPRVLMLDEPLGSLDAALRDRLSIELRAILKAAGLTALYVTHDQQEAFALADRIALMHAGKITQIDTPQTLYNQPQTVYAAEFLGLANVIPVTAYDGETATTPLGRFPLSERANSLLLHPDRLHLKRDGNIGGHIEECVFRGGSYRLKVRHASGIALMFSVAARQGIKLQVGDTVCISVDEEAGVIPLDAGDDDTP